MTSAAAWTRQDNPCRFHAGFRRRGLFDESVVKLVGRDKAIFASVLCGGVLAYGGISGFVIIFSMYPIVLGLFKELTLPGA